MSRADWDDAQMANTALEVARTVAVVAQVAHLRISPCPRLDPQSDPHDLEFTWTAVDLPGISAQVTGTTLDPGGLTWTHHWSGRVGVRHRRRIRSGARAASESRRVVTIRCLPRRAP